MDGGAHGGRQAPSRPAPPCPCHPHGAETDRTGPGRRLALLGRQGHDLRPAADRRPRAVCRCGRIGRCKIWLGETVVAVAPRPMRAFQGWRYYQAKDAPRDIDEAQPGFAEMPEVMRRELASLGLLLSDDLRSRSVIARSRRASKDARLSTGYGDEAIQGRRASYVLWIASA